MHFTKALFVGASFVVAALAQQKIQFTNTPTSVTAGVPIPITWTGGDGTSTITILLKKGDPSNLSTVSTIVQRNAQGNSFTWTPSSTITDADDYAFEIDQAGVSNYSPEFSVTGGVTSSLPVPSTTYFSALSSSTTLAPSASVSSVSAVLSTLAGALSSVAPNSTVISVTTTIGTGIVGTVGTGSIGTGSPSTANTTFSVATLSATTSSGG
ncbi:hypothetical protein MMC06_003028, partial [Schaereria dolodes]|nr:hypothetical protein [Schaereria dolodes]